MRRLLFAARLGGAFRKARLGRDARGATIVEFAVVLPVLCLLLLGLLDLGYRSYATSVVQGALHDASRMATVGSYSLAQIDARVKARLSNFAARSTVTTTTTSYYDFSGVAQAEKIVGDTAPLNSYNAGDCFEDANGNNTYNTDRGRDSTGGADDIVRYQVSITYPRIVPLGGFMGWGNTQTVTQNTVLRNQPFAGRSININRISVAANGTVTQC
ncbi:MAG TPA: TadE/TadG family type IV pilus assembly protein [Allosphingosinicella sp.]|nr:TadE/TadG family type IV pilus assembly protein [Allosphingosinicella sp.]